MNALTKLLLGGGAIVALFAGKKVYNAIALNFYADSSGLSAHMDGITPIVVFRVAIQNPGSESYQLNSFVGNIIANGNTIANFSNYGQTAVKAYGTTYISVAARLSLIGIAADVYQAILNRTGYNQKVQMQAQTDVSGVLLPVSLSYTIGL